MTKNLCHFLMSVVAVLRQFVPKFRVSSSVSSTTIVSTRRIVSSLSPSFCRVQSHHCFFSSKKTFFTTSFVSSFSTHTRTRTLPNNMDVKAATAQEMPLVSELLDFINASPSPFHAVKTATDLLTSAGFEKLSERDVDAFKNLQPGMLFATCGVGFGCLSLPRPCVSPSSLRLSLVLASLPRPCVSPSLPHVSPSSSRISLPPSCLSLVLTSLPPSRLSLASLPRVSPFLASLPPSLMSLPRPRVSPSLPHVSPSSSRLSLPPSRLSLPLLLPHPIPSLVPSPPPHHLSIGGKYYFTRNESTIFAFAVGGKYKTGNGYNIVAAHTDSPCFKVKPSSDVKKSGFVQLGVECYGGGLWNTWFDRDLSVAGRVLVTDGATNKFKSQLVRINRPIMSIPNLAIHLNRTIYSDGFKPNKETHTVPIMATQIKDQLMGADDAKDTSLDQNGNGRSPLLLKLLAAELGCEIADLHDFELCLYDTQPSAIGGVYNEFIHSPRLDNLCMSYCSTRALIDSVADAKSFADDSNIRMVCLFDNEEIGSQSTRGAASSMLLATLERISGKASVDAAIANSFLISADMAHALHPNYPEKHESNHRPAMHKGLVIKANANQRYATTGITAFVLRQIAKNHDIPVQDFVVRNDVGCGSTVGPILSAKTGMRTVDVGAPQFAMHSVREMCASADIKHSVDLFTHFYNEFATVDASIITSD
jgi:aspartyl aminopeptidase